MAKANLTAVRLRELLDYNPETGSFVWKVTPTSYRAKAGDIAGTRNALGYWRIGVDGTDYRSNRLAWLYVHGEWPARYIDHINGDKSDNRIANLRDVSNSVNNQNRKKASSSNLSSGLLGVTKTRGRYQAKLQLDGKSYYLGKFATADEAHQRYLTAKRALHEGCTI